MHTRVCTRAHTPTHTPPQSGSVTGYWSVTQWFPVVALEQCNGSPALEDTKWCILRLSKLVQQGFERITRLFVEKVLGKMEKTLVLIHFSVVKKKSTSFSQNIRDPKCYPLERKIWRGMCSSLRQNEESIMFNAWLYLFFHIQES